MGESVKRTSILLLLVCTFPSFPQPQWESGQPIPIGTQDRLGPLGVGLTSYPVGHARVTGAQGADLFAVAGGQSSEDTTVRAGAPELAESWDVFGPVPLAGTDRMFGVLPSVADLDAGKRFLCRNTAESFESGWMREETIGTSLNLTYISRHGSQVESEKALGGNGHAFLARKRFLSSQARMLAAVLTHDDPVEVELNGKVVYRAAEPFRGFQSRGFELPAREGVNELVVRLSSYFNETFNWAGFNLSLTDAAGNAVRLSDLN